MRNTKLLSKESRLLKLKKLTVTMFAVCFVFIVTTLPGEVFILLFAVSKLLGTDVVTYQSLFMIISSNLDYINHSINFFLYYLSGL